MARRLLEWHRPRLLLGERIADRPAGCDAGLCGCVGYTLSIKAVLFSLSWKLEWHQLSSERTADHLVGCCVGYTLSIEAAALDLFEA